MDNLLVSFANDGETTQPKLKAHPTSPRCEESMEIVHHILMECLWAVELWEIALGLQVFSLCYGSFQDWTSEILCQKAEGDQQLFAMLAWAIWNARNEWVHNQSKQTPEKAVEFVI